MTCVCVCVCLIQRAVGISSVVMMAGVYHRWLDAIDGVTVRMAAMKLTAVRLFLFHFHTHIQFSHIKYN